MPMAVDHKTKEPSVRSPTLWRPLPLLLMVGCTSGAIASGLVRQNGSNSTATVGVVGGLLVSAVVAIGAVAAAVAALMTWITVVVMLWFIGRSRRRLVVEGRKISKEIMVGFVVKVMFKEGNVLGAICGAVLGYLAFAWGPLLLLPTPNYFG